MRDRAEVGDSVSVGLAAYAPPTAPCATCGSETRIAVRGTDCRVCSNPACRAETGTVHVTVGPIAKTVAWWSAPYPAAALRALLDIPMHRKLLLSVPSEGGDPPLSSRASARIARMAPNDRPVRPCPVCGSESKAGSPAGRVCSSRACRHAWGTERREVTEPLVLVDGMRFDIG